MAQISAMHHTGISAVMIISEQNQGQGPKTQASLTNDKHSTQSKHMIIMIIHTTNVQWSLDFRPPISARKIWS